VGHQDSKVSAAMMLLNIRMRATQYGFTIKALFSLVVFIKNSRFVKKQNESFLSEC
jgi:hypothetical protein